jgi:hypothetical protein
MRRLWGMLLLSLAAVLLIVAGCGQGAISNGDSENDVPYIAEPKGTDSPVEPETDMEIPDG